MSRRQLNRQWFLMTFQENNLEEKKDEYDDELVFTYGVVQNLLQFPDNTMKKIVKCVDKKRKDRSSRFSHRTVLIYFVFFTLINTKGMSLKQLISFEWENVFKIMDGWHIEDLLRLCLVYKHGSKHVVLVSIDQYVELVSGDRFQGVKLETVYIDYLSRMDYRFESKADERENSSELADLLVKQNGMSEIVADLSVVRIPTKDDLGQICLLRLLPKV